VRDARLPRAGFECVEALGRIIIRGPSVVKKQSGGVLVWLSVWSKVQTTLWSTYKLYDLHAIFYSRLSVSKVFYVSLGNKYFYCFCGSLLVVEAPGPLFAPTLLKYSKIRDHSFGTFNCTKLWTFKYRHCTSIVATCCQLSSTNVDAQCDKLAFVVSQLGNTCERRLTTLSSLSYWASTSVHHVHDMRQVARRAGPSAAGDSRAS